MNIKKSLIIPVYKNEENIPSLLSALTNLYKNIGNDFEAVFVVDGSPDNSYNLLTQQLPLLDFPTQLISHSRNFGSFPAIRTGLQAARGKYFAVMAADLQEPPELILEFFSTLEKGSIDVVFGQRTGRKDKPLQKHLANVYWAIYRKMVISDIPKGGVDIFACNEVVRSAILSIEEPNSSLIAQLFWVGYRRLFIPYERQERLHGESSWKMSTRIKYMLDSIFSYSDYPVLFILWLGVAGVTFSVFIAFITIVAKLLGLIDVPGYTTLLLGGLFFGSAILATQGILGCYIWRALENTKKRPLSLISESHNFSKDNSNAD